MNARDERLGPQRRIKRRAEFLRLQQGGRKYRGRRLLLVVSRPAGAERESRIGITITKKIDKRAVARNRLRRCIREIFRRVRPRLREPVDLVVIALSGAAELDYHAIHRELMYLLGKAGVIGDDRSRAGERRSGSGSTRRH